MLNRKMAASTRAGVTVPPLDALAAALDRVRALARAGLNGPEVWEPLLAVGGKDSAYSSTGPVGAAGSVEAWAESMASTALGRYSAAVLAVYRLAREVGSSTAELLDAVVLSLRDAQETLDVREAALAGPRSSARLLQFLPLLGMGLGGGMGANPLAVLFGGGAGTVALAVGISLLIAGRAWSALLVKAAARPGNTDALVCAVLAAAMRSGLPLPAALRQVGTAWDSPVGAALAGAGSELAQGQPWDEVWSVAVNRAGEEGDGASLVEEIRSALWLVWNFGVEAAPLLEGVAERASRAERRRLNQAAARLGVYLMAPLGLCFLPAFVALGLVPVLLSFATGLLPAF